MPEAFFALGNRAPELAKKSKKKTIVMQAITPGPRL